MPDIQLDRDKQPMSAMIFDAIVAAGPDLEHHPDPGVQRLYALVGQVLGAVTAIEAQINMGYPRPEYNTDPDLAGPSGAREVPAREIPDERYGPLHVRLLEVERRLGIAN